MSIGYGIDVQDQGDPLIARAEHVLEAVNSLHPGRYLVDILTFREYHAVLVSSRCAKFFGSSKACSGMGTRSDVQNRRAPMARVCGGPARCPLQAGEGQDGPSHYVPKFCTISHDLLRQTILRRRPTAWPNRS